MHLLKTLFSVAQKVVDGIKSGNQFHPLNSGTRPRGRPKEEKKYNLTIFDNCPLSSAPPYLDFKLPPSGGRQLQAGYSCLSCLSWPELCDFQ